MNVYRIQRTATALAIVAMSCTAGLDVPDRIEAACDSDAECPDGNVCDTVLQRCVSTSREDQTPPRVLSAAVAPERFGPGTVLTASFSTDEALGRPPTITFLGQTFVGESTGDRTYRVVFTAPSAGTTASESVRALIVDDSLNSATPLLGTVQGDYTGPAVTDFFFIDETPLAPDGVAEFVASTEIDAQIVAARVLDGDGAEVGLPELALDTDESGVIAVLRVRGQVRASALAPLPARLVVAVDVVDPLGNVSTANSPALAVNRDPPDTRIDSSPAAEANRLRASFTFSSTEPDVVSYECDLDQRGFAPCTSPFEEKLGTPGTHVFEVRAVDVTGLVDETPARFSWNETREWLGPGAFSIDCAVASDGTLWCWDGFTAGDVLGVQTTAPVQVGNEADWLTVDSSDDGTCGIREDSGTHSVWCWGEISVEGAQSVFPRRGRETGFVSISLTSSAACGLKEDGTLWCWGANVPLASGSLGSSSTMVQVGSASDWIHVHAGKSATCGIRNEQGAQNAYCWGRTSAGDPTLTFFETPTRVGLASDWLTLTTTDNRGCGIRDVAGTRSLWCFGELIDGTAVGSPTQVGPDADWQKIDASHRGFCGVQGDGSLWCWGRSGDGFTDDLQRIESDVPVRISTGSSWTDFSVGETGFFEDAVCSMDADKQLRCQGASARDDLGGGGPDFARVDSDLSWSALSTSLSGSNATCGIAADTEQALCWGRGSTGLFRQPNDYQPSPRPVDAGSWSAIHLELDEGCGIKDGRLQCWGTGRDPSYVFSDPTVQFSPADDWLTVVGARPNQPTFCAIRADDPGNTLWCWGDNPYGNLGLGDTVARDEPTQVGVSQAYEFGWQHLSYGDFHVCGIRQEGAARELYCWGRSQSDVFRLGTGSSDDEWTPARIGNETDWLTVSAGGRNSCGVRGTPGNAELWCWGRGREGQLGNGILSIQAIPVRIGDLDDWVHVEAGTNGACATRADGSLWCWGQSFGGFPVPGLNVPEVPFPTRVSVPGGPVSLFTLSDRHACAQTDALYCWGDDSQGLLGHGIGRGPIVSDGP